MPAPRKFPRPRPRKFPSPRARKRAGQPNRDGGESPDIRIATAELKARVWIEKGGAPALTEAAADLLDQIDVCGSLSEAARRLGFSYRRAWLLLDMTNQGWPQALATTAIGGRRGGGSRLTEYGRVVLGAYRDLQARLEFLLEAAAHDFKAATGTGETSAASKLPD